MNAVTGQLYIQDQFFISKRKFKSCATDTEEANGQACLSAPPEGPGYSPGIGLLITVVQRFKTLLLLLLA